MTGPTVAEHPAEEVKRWLLDQWQGRLRPSEVNARRAEDADGRDAWYFMVILSEPDRETWNADDLAELRRAVRDKAGGHPAFPSRGQTTRCSASSRLGPAPPSTVDPHRREAVAGFGLREGGPAACDVPRSLHGFRRAQCAASAIEGRVVGTDDPFRRAHQSRIAGSGRGPVPAHEGIPARLHRSGCRVRGALGCKGHRRHRRPL